MTRNSFHTLCETITAKIGEDLFKSEEWLISEARKPKRTDRANELFGGPLPGEIKVAIMLRILGGASYLDLLAIYGIVHRTVYDSFHEAIGWVCSTFHFPLKDWIMNKNTESLDRVGEAFGVATGGLFKSCIGALDGVAIKINNPTVYNLISDPGNYFCRKGFYALNVQAICDRHKRVLWVSTGHKGSTHDSSAFGETKFCKILEDFSEWLEENGYFFIGDSAYTLLGYFLVPYSDPPPNSAEDAFNFWLSNSRIQIECTFGEIVMRWGIFWRKLLFGIEKVGSIINAALLLHNFLVDEREADVGLNSEDAAFFRNFSLQKEDDRLSASDEHPNAVVTDNNEPHPGGRPTNDMSVAQAKGKRKRDEIASLLYGSGKSRPMRSNMSYNSEGHVYFNS
jgi:hypothetical protein